MLQTTSDSPLIGLVHLATDAFAGIDLQPVGEHLVARFNQNPDDASALMDLSTLCFLLHRQEDALHYQQAAVQFQRRYQLSSSPEKPALKLLALLGLGNFMDNLPVEFLLEGSQIAMDLHYMLLADDLPDDIQDYDIIIIAVGESDRNRPLLQQLQAQLHDYPKPIINMPQAIMQTTREDAANALDNAAGVVMPCSVRMTPQALRAVGEGTTQLSQYLMQTTFPIIVRPVASHGGQGLERLDQAGDIDAYLRAQADTDMFYISPYINYASGDGLFRKYRVVLMKGAPFLAHLAISSHWLVHYLNADMLENDAKRIEEAACMADFDTGFGLQHQQAFQSIYDALQLEYLIIDCAETDTGELLVFEVDTSAIVHAMDSVECFPYKQPQMHKIFHAFQAMLHASCQP